MISSFQVKQVAGVFVQSTLETVVETPVPTITGVVVGGFVIVGLATGVTEAVAGIGAVITYLLNLFSNAHSF